MITSSSANEWKLSQLLHELVFVPWIQAVWSCTQLRLIFSWRQMVFWVVFWFFFRRGDADDFGLKCDPEILSKLLLVLSHGWKNLGRQAADWWSSAFWNYSAALSDFEWCCYSFKFDAIMQVLHFHFSPKIWAQSGYCYICGFLAGTTCKSLPAVQNNRDLQVLWRMITVLTIEEIPHYGDQFKYQCQLIFFIEISSLLISNFHAQPWFLTLFKNPGIYFVKIPMPFSSWSSEPVCSPV